MAGEPERLSLAGFWPRAGNAVRDDQRRKCERPSANKGVMAKRHESTRKLDAGFRAEE